MEIFDKNSAAEKSDPKKTRIEKYLPSCQLGLKRKNRKQYEYKDIINFRHLTARNVLPLKHENNFEHQSWWILLNLVTATKMKSTIFV